MPSSIESLDLDINHYSIADLEAFFKLKPKTIYTADDIELKEYQIREQLLSSGHINRRFKRDLIEFLESAKQLLIQKKCKPIKQMTSIPTNYKLDQYDVPKSRVPPSRSEEIIDRPPTSFVYSQNSDFFPGTMNPLSTRVITKCLTIDTRFRDNLYTTQSSDFIIQLPTRFNKVVSMQLSSIDFPISFYGISAAYGNNYFNLGVNYNSTDISGQVIDASMTVIIPDGNYNGNDLISYLNAALQTQAPAAMSNIFGSIKTILNISAGGSGTGTVTFQLSGAYSTYINKITLDFASDINGNMDNARLSSKFGWNIGYIKPHYSGKNTYTGDTVIEPVSGRYLYLVVDDFQNSSNNQFVSVFNKSILSPGILARISMKASFFNIIQENDFTIATEPRVYFGPVDIQKLHIKILDEYGRVLANNNSNFSLTLNLKLLYDL